MDEIAGRMAIVEVLYPVSYGAELVRQVKSGKFQPQLGLKIKQRRAAEQQHEARLRDGRALVSLTANRSFDHLPKNLRASLEAIRVKSLTISKSNEPDDDSTS